MARLKWNLAEVVKLTEVAKAAKAWSMGYDDGEPEPALFFVKDEGVYLMPNCVYEDGKTASSEGHVLYAKGFDPSKNEDWWNAAEAACGGDDFGETLRLSSLGDLSKVAAAGYTKFIIELGKTQLKVVYAK